MSTEPKRMGRIPKSPEDRLVSITFRLPAPVADEIYRRAGKRGTSVGEFLRGLLPGALTRA